MLEFNADEGSGRLWALAKRDRSRQRGGGCAYVTQHDRDLGRLSVEWTLQHTDRRLRHARANHVEEIRSHTAAHQPRLAALIPSLVAEFEGRRTLDEIRDCADAVLSEYDDVPIRTHVLAIAGRRAGKCLPADTCDALAKAL